MAATPPKQERDKRQVMATNLELLVCLKVMTILSIVRRLTKGRAKGLAKLIPLGGEQRLRSLLKFWPDKKADAAAISFQFMMQGTETTVEEHLVGHISDEDLAELFERWMSTEVEVGHRLTFEQVTNFFDPDDLSDCVRHGLVMVGVLPPYETHNMPSGVPDDGHPAADTAPQVIEEDVDAAEEAFAEKVSEEVRIVPAEPPADANAPQAREEDIDDAPLAAGRLTGPITSGK